MKRLVPLLPMVLALAACDQLGIDTPAKVEAAKAAEGKAIGSACRQSMRALEDCYSQNPKASKAAIFAGWKEMDGYMRDNNIPGIPPAAAASDGGDGSGGNAASDGSGGGSGDKPDNKIPGKGADKPSDKGAKPGAKAAAK